MEYVQAGATKCVAQIGNLSHIKYSRTFEDYEIILFNIATLTNPLVLF